MSSARHTFNNVSKILTKNDLLVKNSRATSKLWGERKKNLISSQNAKRWRTLEVRHFFIEFPLAAAQRVLKYLDIPHLAPPLSRCVNIYQTFFVSSAASSGNLKPNRWPLELLSQKKIYHSGEEIIGRKNSSGLLIALKTTSNNYDGLSEFHLFAENKLEEMFWLIYRLLYCENIFSDLFLNIIRRCL